MMKGAVGLTSRLIAHHRVGLVGGCSAGMEVLAVGWNFLLSLLEVLQCRSHSGLISRLWGSIV